MALKLYYYDIATPHHLTTVALVLIVNQHNVSDAVERG